ncbi:MAG: DUF444 family protein [Bacteroidales bacterium]|nr:DUF444 family protein [Bacteroidales bacterium]
MQKHLKNILRHYFSKGLSKEQKELIKYELKMMETANELNDARIFKEKEHDIYEPGDGIFLQKFVPPSNPVMNIQTLEELLKRDSKREKDGFRRRILLGKFIRPGGANGTKVVVVPSTTEPKFYHDDSISEDEDEDQTGGSGDGEEGEVIGEQQAEPEDGEGQGAGQGGGAEHDISTDAFDLGKVLTEEFQLPNLKDKGKKRSVTKYNYELTDKNRGFGQILDKKATIKKVIQTNILLGKIKEGENFKPEDLIINPNDEVYRILSKEKAYESQAIVFFLRDYSGSMQGKPSEIITTQHLLIFSWLMYQYKNNVLSRFILHDTDAKEVLDFHQYYTLQVAGGTQVAPAFKLVNEIVEKEQLEKDYNIYVFYGTDGDDWDTNGEEMLPALKTMLEYSNRVGITIARNNWSSGKETTVEQYLKSSQILQTKADLVKMDAMDSDEGTEDRIIEGIRRLVS